MAQTRMLAKPETQVEVEMLQAGAKAFVV
jgi:hypothetical protein